MSLLKWYFNVLVVRSEGNGKEFEALYQWMLNNDKTPDEVRHYMDYSQLSLGYGSEDSQKEFVLSLHKQFPNLRIMGSSQGMTHAEAYWFDCEGGKPFIADVEFDEDAKCSCMRAATLKDAQEEVRSANGYSDKDIELITAAWTTELDKECECDEE